MTELHLYGSADSGHACKVALALSLAGLDHTITAVDIFAPRETRAADFVALTPFAEVPVLVIDGRPYLQSGAILLEIAERFKVLGGETHDGLMRGRELILWEANRIGMCLPQLLAARRGESGFNDGAIEWLRARFAVDAARFGVLLDGQDFFHGASPGIGDCAIWGYVQWANDAGVDVPSVITKWTNRMRALPQMRRPEEFFPAETKRPA